MARPLDSPNAPPKPRGRISLVSPINRAGRKNASFKAVPRGNVVVVNHAAPAPPPHRVIPTQATPVTPQQVQQRQARHQIRLKAHQQRVNAKQIRQAKAVDAATNFHDKQLAEITRANYYGPRGKPVVNVPSQGDPVAHGLTAHPDPGKVLRDAERLIPTIKVPKSVAAFGTKAVINSVFGANTADNISKSHAGKKVLNFTEGQANDLLNAAVNAPASTLLMALHPKQTIKQFPNTDPVGRFIAHGDPSLILKHPAIAALEIGGVKSALGNTAGRVMRSGVLGASAKRAASLDRPNLKLYSNVDNGPEVGRRYSRDITQKALQVANERRKARKGQDPHVATGHAQRKLVKKMTVDELAASEGLRRRATAEQGSATAQTLTPTHSLKVRAPHVSRSARRSKKLRTEGITKAHQRAVPLIVDNTIRHMDHPQVEADLQNKLRILSNVDRSKLNHAQVKLHDAQVEQVKGLLADKKFLADPTPAFEAAAKLKVQQAPRTQALRDKKLLSEDQQSAPYVPYAINHMRAHPAAEKQVVVTPSGDVLSAEEATGHIGKAQKQLEVAQAGVKQAESSLNALNIRLKHERKMGMISPNKANDLIDRADRLERAQKNLAAADEMARLTRKTYKKTDKAFLESASGHPITVDQIKAHMQAHSVKEPGFFSQRPGSTGNARFYTRIINRKGQRPKEPSQPRTGTASMEGTHAAGPDVLVAQAAHEGNITTQAGNLDRMQGQFGIGKPSADPKDRFFKSHSDAHTAAKELGPATGNVDRHGDSTLVPMNVGRAKAIHDLIDSAAPTEEAATQVSQMVNKMFEDTGAGQYTLVPRKFQQLLEASVKPSPDWQRTLENVTRVWKKTILTTSTKWMFGNMADLSLRAVLSGVNPLDVVRGKQVVRLAEKQNPEAARLLMERTQTSPSTGGLFGGSSRLDKVNPSRLAKANPLRVPAGAWKAWTTGVSHLNTAMEHGLAYGTIGRDARREVRREVDSLNSITAVGEKAFADYARGLQETPEQLRVANEVEKVLGRWGKLGPDARAWLVHAPFVQWLFVSTKFVFVTLPRDHPIKTAILASLSQMTEQQRKQLGLNIDIAHNDPNAVKPYLQGGIPFKGGIMPAQRYSSFGTLAGGLPGLADFVFPQATAFKNTVNAKTFTGSDIKNPDGSAPSDTQLADMAVYQLAEGFIPFAGPARRVLEKGGVSTPDSTLWNPKTFPGTSSSLAAGLNKAYNPLRPFKIVRKGGTSTGGSAPSGFGGGGGGGGGGFPSAGGSSGGGFPTH